MTANDSISLQLATWAPRGNALVYVYQNNIYYRPEAEVAVDYQITDTGVFGTIYNGVPDWVYEGKFLVIRTSPHARPSHLRSTIEFIIRGNDYTRDLLTAVL